MSALPKLDDDGQIRVPKEIRDAAGLHPGDAVSFRVVGPGKVELSLLRPMSLDAFIAKYGRGEPIADRNAFREKAEVEQGDWRSIEFPRLTLDELLSLYRINEPYDDAATREAWQAEAGEEVADRMRRGIE